jgi:hypothetical protein
LTGVSLSLPDPSNSSQISVVSLLPNQAAFEELRGEIANRAPAQSRS